MASKPSMVVEPHDHDTRLGDAEYEAFVSRFTSDPTTGEPAKPPTDPPIMRRYVSATGSGASIPTTGRIPTIDGHQSQVIGTYARTLDDDDAVTYAATSGAPQGWSTGQPDATALPKTETRVTRSRKGRTSFRPIGPRPSHRVTGGVTDYVDPLADMAANLVACANPAEHRVIPSRPNRCRCALTERHLVALADTMLECHVATVCRSANGRFIPPTVKLIGDAITRPEVIPGDRASVSQCTLGERTAMGALIVSNGDLGAFFGIDGLTNEFASGASKRGMVETSLTWATRHSIPRANRLHKSTQLAKASVSVLATVRVSGKHGELAEVVKTGTRGRGVSRVIGRRTTVATKRKPVVLSANGARADDFETVHADGSVTNLVSFTDRGWFIGHEHTAVASKPAAARVARLAERRQERDNARQALRAETMAQNEATGREGIAPVAASDAVTNSPLQTIRAMDIGQTIAGLTRTHASRWTDGQTTYSSHATAAIALTKLSATV